MPHGELTCRCPHSPSVLHVFVGKKRIGYLCNDCARHSPTLRAFLQSAAWLYDWRFLTFSFVHAGTTEGFRDYLEIVIRQEGDRVAFLRNDKLAQRIARSAAWASAEELPPGYLVPSSEVAASAEAVEAYQPDPW